MNDLRPKRFAQVVGQKELINRIRTSIKAAKQRKQMPSHILFDGPAGIGKTTLAGCIAYELGVPFFHTIGPTLQDIEDVIKFVLAPNKPSVLFIDEIHQLPKEVEEYLYPVLEDSRLEIKTDEANTHIDLPEITFVGATTLSGTLSAPFRDRFPIREHLDYYKESELSTLIKRNSVTMNINLDSGVSVYLAGVSRGTPRIANNRLKWIRDYAQVRNQKQIKLTLVLDALAEQKIDHLGLDQRDRQMMQTIQEKFNNRPVGLQSLASAIGMDKETLESEVEPWLVRCNLLNRTARGRQLSEKGITHLAKGE